MGGAACKSDCAFDEDNAGDDVRRLVLEKKEVVDMSSVLAEPPKEASEPREDHAEHARRAARRQDLWPDTLCPITLASERHRRRPTAGERRRASETSPTIAAHAQPRANAELADEFPGPHESKIVLKTRDTFELELAAQQEVLNRCEELHGSQSLQVAGALEALAHVNRKMERHREQMQLLIRAVPIREKHLGSNDPSVAEALVELSLAFGKLGGNPRRRKQLLERALDIERTSFGQASAEAARTQARLANVHGEMGDPGTKLRLLSDSLAMLGKANNSSDNVEVASILTNMGNAYMMMGLVQQQRAALERSLQMKERLYGTSDESLATTLSSLANAYGRQGHHDREEKLLLRALTIIELNHGKENWRSSTILDNLGMLRMRKSDLRGAAQLFERALAIKEKADGSDHPQVAITLANLALTYGISGQKDKKLKLLNRAVCIIEGFHGPDNPRARRLRQLMTTDLGQVDICAYLDELQPATPRALWSPRWKGPASDILPPRSSSHDVSGLSALTSRGQA